MDNPQSGEPVHTKYFRSFWPILAIAVISAVVGGAVVWVAFNSSVADDLSSMVLVHHKKITPPKTKQMVPTTSAAPQN